MHQFGWFITSINLHNLHVHLHFPMDFHMFAIPTLDLRQNVQAAYAQLSQLGAI